MDLKLLVILAIIGTIMNMGISLCQWNMNGFNTSQLYLDQLMNSYDIIAISEHKLYPANKHKLNIKPDKFGMVSKCSQHLDPQNCGIVWGCGGVVRVDSRWWDRDTWTLTLQGSPSNVSGRRGMVRGN